MKVLVTGTSGQLGSEVMNELIRRGHEAIGADRSDSDAGFPHIILDITDKDLVESKISEIHPDAIIHCAAWTAVDAAEDETNIDKVRAVNVDGTKNLASACGKVGGKCV